MKKTKVERLLEIIPGLVMWTTFISPIILSFFAPFIVSLVILIYAIYWLLKTIVVSFHLIQGYQRYKLDSKVDWLKRCQSTFPVESQWKKIYHLVIVATVREDLAILRSTFQALINSDYPKDRLIVVLATEERAQDTAFEISKALEKEFGSAFYKLLTTIHTVLPDEVTGKGGNINFAAKQAKVEIIDKNKIPYEDVIVTTLDADHRVDKQYFACLTYNYLQTPDPIHKSFQPIPLFFNNIWQTGFPMRMMAMGTSFWQMVEATRPHRLRNFASHSQSLAGLIETDFWSAKTIVEDGHQYWRSYFAFHGNYRVVPIFVPIYSDAVLAGDLWQTAKEQYLQQRRWSWGVSDFPYAVIHAWKDKKAPFFDKWTQVFRLFDGIYSWSTSSVILASVGWMPIILNPDFRDTVIAYNFPYFYSRILTVAMIGMLVTLTISTVLLPPGPSQRRSSRWRILREWILTPFTMAIITILFSTIPAIESQTRLMIGKYLESFRVTIKKPVPEQES